MRQQRGFTLIELMIVVAVIAVLAAIALPNFQEQGRKGRRAEATRAVGEYQLSMERWRAENPTYGACPTGVTCSGTRPALPTGDFYTMSEPTPATAASYTIRATPAGRQVGDRCANLNATNLAKPTWSGDADCNN